MELGDVHYNKNEYVETASGNKVCRQTVLCGSQNIILQGKVIIQAEAIIRGDLANVKTGRYCIISREAVLRPPYKKFSKGVAFFPLSIGDHVFIGERTLINAAQIGSYVYIGKNCVIVRHLTKLNPTPLRLRVLFPSFFFRRKEYGRRCILKDCCVIEDNTVLAPETVVPPFTKYGGSAAVQTGELPECQADLMVDYTRSYYQHFQPKFV